MSSRPLRVLLLTEGDPLQLTGGYRYHRRMAELAGKHAAEVTFVSVPALPFPLAILSRASRLQRIPGADVVVLDSIAAAYAAPWLGRMRPRVPVVAMLHQLPGGVDHGPVRSVVQGALDRRALRSSATIMVASAWLGDQLRQSVTKLAPIVVVPPGRDLPPAANGSAPVLRRGAEAVFLTVANWLPPKGIDLLLEAFARLPEGTARLHLVGRTDMDASYARKLRRRLSQSDLAERVTVYGPQPPQKLAAFYAAADAFALPSFVETYGMVYAEAMVCGLPIIAWNIGNLPYLATDGKEGFLVRRGDLTGFSDALERLATDAGLRRRMGEAARRRSASFPTWDESASLFFRTLRSAAA